MIDERLEEQAASYALGCLPAEELAAFETVLRRDPELQRLVADLQSLTEVVAGTAPLVNPPPALREKILSAVGSEQKIVPLPAARAEVKPLQSWVPWALAACLAVLCVVFAAREKSLRDRFQDLNQLATNLQGATNNLQQTIVALQETNRVNNLRIAMLGSLLSDQPNAVAFSVWDDQEQTGVLLVKNMKPLARDRDYQLWVIDPNYQNPVDAGVFQVDANGNMRVNFKTKLPIKTAGKFAVTEEIKGGVAVTKGPIILVSN